MNLLACTNKIFWTEMNEHSIDILLTVLNLGLLLITMGWQFSNRRYQVKDNLLSDLKDQVEAKELVIKDLKRSKDQYKAQYLNLLHKHSKVEGELKAHRDILGSTTGQSKIS